MLANVEIAEKSLKRIFPTQIIVIIQYGQEQALAEPAGAEQELVRIALILQELNKTGLINISIAALNNICEI
jgi:hypothetical protein